MEQHINLQRLAAIKICSVIFKFKYTLLRFSELFPPIINDVRRQRFLRTVQNVNPQEVGEHEDRYQKFQIVSRLTKHYLNLITDNLPLNLQIYCEHVITEMSEKLYYWMEYVDVKLDFDIKLPNKIYWTPLGTVDESKIIEIWETDQEFLNVQNFRFHAFESSPHVLYRIYPLPLSHALACLYVQEEFIENHQDEMERHLRIYFPEFRLRNYENKVYTLLTLYLNVYIIKEGAIEIRDFNDSGYIISPSTMLENCVRACIHKPVYYYWGILKNFGYEEKFLINITTDCLRRYKRDDNYLRGKSAEIAIFLINQIPMLHRNNFIHKNAKLLFCGILPAWSFNEIIVELIDNFFSHVSVAEYQDIFNYIQQLICDNHQQEGPKIKLKYFYQVFEKLFTNLSRDLKDNVFTSRFILNNFKMFDIKCLSIVMSKKDAKSRARILTSLRPEILLLAQEGKMDRLRQFILEILISDSERNEYKRYLRNGRFLIEMEYNEVMMMMNI